MISNEIDLAATHDEKSEFMHDIHAGLSKPNKQIQSKYFYDEHGSELFNKITHHPDYYLTNCEIEILNQNKKHIAQQINAASFNLIELGPGEGIKTQILMEEFLQKSLNFSYIPIDVSKKYLKLVIHRCKQTLPSLQFKAIHADYFRGIEWIQEHSDRRNLLLFLGSSIGNFDAAMTIEFLRHLCDSLNEGDYVLLGFDLRKDIGILLRAYDDTAGITRDFNLNLLNRINRELGANFDLKKFRHYATYNVYSGAMESYLVSLEKQIIYIDAFNGSYSFEAIEPIHVEYSHKYSLTQIDGLAHKTGFEVVENFSDARKYFVDTLWRVSKR